MVLLTKLSFCQSFFMKLKLTVYRVAAHKLNTYMMRQLRLILNIKQGIIDSRNYVCRNYKSLHKGVGLPPNVSVLKKNQHDEYVYTEEYRETSDGQDMSTE